MKMNPVKGTADYLPSQTLLRDYLQNSILETYRAAGFERILTPAIEDMENLEKSEGGDNLNLMFKILKRGDKLDAALEKQDYKNLADLGLRYDLTLPLSRFMQQTAQNCLCLLSVSRSTSPTAQSVRRKEECASLYSVTLIFWEAILLCASWS